jgi:hypothetical protein
MMNKWDGHERRTNSEDREGRRVGDQRCPDHHLLWKHHDAENETFKDGVERNQGLACSKIKALEEYHIRDVGEVKEALGKKADRLELRPIVTSVRNLIIIGCLVVGAIMGTSLIWLKADIAGSKTDASENAKSIKADLDNVAGSVQRLNIRITNSTAEAMTRDTRQTEQLGEIAGELKTTNWRLSKLEDQHKDGKK